MKIKQTREVQKLNFKLKISGFRIQKDTCFLFFYLISFFLRFFTYMNKTLTALIWIICGIVILIRCLLKLNGKEPIIYLILIVDLVAFINGYFNGNNTYIDVLYLVSAQSFGIYIYLLRNRWNFFRNILLFLYAFIVLKVIIFRFNDPMNDIELSTLIGKNSVSIILIFICSIDVIYRIRNNKKMNYFVYIVGIIISVLCDSSGGILGFVLFGIGIFICTKKGNKISWRKVLLFLTISISIIAVQDYIPKIIEFLSDDNSRFTLWHMYIELVKHSFMNVLFGAALYKNPILLHYRNIHNNFLNWHCFFGLIPTIFFSSMVIICGVYYLKKKNWPYLVIWIVLFVRSITDGTDYCFMTLWIYMLLDVISSKRKVES